MADFEEKGDVFLKWLKNNGTTLSESIALKDYRSENAGRGVIATKDIKEGDLLFSLPRTILLSQLTTGLSKMEGVSEDLTKLTGWSPLIVSMMYESQKEDSFWKPYFDVLPRAFSTPMFWSEDDLKELEGTDIVAKIGKADAEEAFNNEIMPFMKKYPEIFDENVHTLELFHICGSLIMAYSFSDEFQKNKEENEQEIMSDDDEEEEEEEEENEEMIAMVPMADMLNHKTGFNNARLFYEADSLQMKAIKDIKEGEQIFNTYGDLCNADLLRKYGFTDKKNPFDLVELDGPLVVKNCSGNQNESVIEKKIDFLMEEGALDECFVIDTEHEIPPELIVSVHVLRSTQNEFKKMEEKQKLPKPKLTIEAKQAIQNILKQRLEKYPTTLKDDELQLKKDINNNKRNALIVRIGEKKIIESTLETLESMPVVSNNNEKKRPANSNSNANKKQRK
ncbi:MAG: hypothetical protein EXX96DRAFT_583114 [Benjaminiella poitrasii]|nr:MAG: hypothetical protein EXX96DRAFT_583114 [Benjaminiella poitrasii]